jgi:hypothetical protein
MPVFLRPCGGLRTDQAPRDRPHPERSLHSEVRNGAADGVVAACDSRRRRRVGERRRQPMANEATVREPEKKTKGWRAIERSVKRARVRIFGNWGASGVCAARVGVRAQPRDLLPRRSNVCGWYRDLAPVSQTLASFPRSPFLSLARHTCALASNQPSRVAEPEQAGA